MGMIYDNIQRVRTQIAAAVAQAEQPALAGERPQLPTSLSAVRKTQAVTLLAVSKTFGAQAVREAYDAGQRAFGENYLQEGVEKIAALADLPGIEWHMIGPIQSNKTRLVAENFAWVHSIDRLKTAQRLSEQRPAGMPPLQVCIQVNVDGGANKAGVAPDEALALALAVAALPQLQLRGMMAIPEPAINFVAACALFTSAFEVFTSLKQAIPGVDTCSMGMSADMQAAIASGSTMVRVGSAIFGQRV